MPGVCVFIGSEQMRNMLFRSPSVHEPQTGMSSRRERKAKEAERTRPMSTVAEVESAQASRVQSPEGKVATVAPPLASPLRNEKKLARLRRRGQLDEFKQELVDEVRHAPWLLALRRALGRAAVTQASRLPRRCSSRAAPLQI